MTEILIDAKRYTVKTYFAKSELLYHLTGTDVEPVAVRLLLPLHRKRHTTDMLFLLLKKAKGSSYSSVILFDTGTGHKYKKT